ncbi:transglycosylase domain-containing protein [Salinactinospora qingdaonensis]|uniref:Penicillin-insensitive transglycosylase n=1 Tax=Salinactinospora qingdaonensis TaxID=702744 RepID=A0ABP7G7A2_9ACTN
MDSKQPEPNDHTDEGSDARPTTPGDTSAEATSRAVSSDVFGTDESPADSGTGTAGHQSLGGEDAFAAPASGTAPQPESAPGDVHDPEANHATQSYDHQTYAGSTTGFDWFGSTESLGEEGTESTAQREPSEEATATDDSPYTGASAFKDSGSFFRDKVARNLAEQYGLTLDEEGRITQAEDTADAPASAAETSVAPDAAGEEPDGTASDSSTSSVSGSSDPQEETVRLSPGDEAGGGEAEPVGVEPETVRLSPGGEAGEDVDATATASFAIPAELRGESSSDVSGGDAGVESSDPQEETVRLSPGDEAGGGEAEPVGVEPETVRLSPGGEAGEDVDATATASFAIPAELRGESSSDVSGGDAGVESSDPQEETVRLSPGGEAGGGEAEPVGVEPETVRLSPGDDGIAEAADEVGAVAADPAGAEPEAGQPPPGDEDGVGGTASEVGAVAGDPAGADPETTWLSPAVPQSESPAATAAFDATESPHSPANAPTPESGPSDSAETTVRSFAGQEPTAEHTVAATGATPEPETDSSRYDGWDPEGTAAFTPVFDDADDADDANDDDDGELAGSPTTSPSETRPSPDTTPDRRHGPPSRDEPTAGSHPSAEPPAAESATATSGATDTESQFDGAATSGAAPTETTLSGIPSRPAGRGDPASSQQRRDETIASQRAAGADTTEASSPATTAAGASQGRGGPPEPPSPTPSGGADDNGSTASLTKTRPPKSGGTKAGKNGKRKRPLWFRLTRAGIFTVAVMFVLATIGFGVAYATIPVPNATQAQVMYQGSTFYYSDGETVFSERGVNRDPVDLEEVPERVQNAILSAENRGFWDEPGVSITGTMRAAFSTLTGQQVQGGSTITQQMVRNYYEGLSQERTVSRKMREIIISLKVDRSQPKEWILEQYLNTIYFGRNAYGIQAAAQAYYHKDVGDLTSSEAALLAAAIQQPTKFGLADSETTPEMENRWGYVVDGLVSMGTISQAEAQEYEFPKPNEQIPQEGVDLSGYKGYMLQQAMAELKELGYDEDSINRGGYKVVTSFDKRLMEAAKEAVNTHVPPEDRSEGVKVGLTAVNPANGEVVAFYGGEDYMANQYDTAFNGTAQIGSSFKPYVLATALHQGYSLNSMVDGSYPQTFNGKSITSHGPNRPIDLIEATAFSSNTGYINLGLNVGLKEVRQMAYDMGLPEGSIKDHQLVPVMPLGVSSVSPFDQASAYGTFANGGVRVEPHVVREVINLDGENERPEVGSNRVLSQDEAADATHALEQVLNYGTAAGKKPGRPAAGKTGTTDGNVAAWFAGYTPQLSAAVGIYSADNKSTVSLPYYGPISGGSAPADVWETFMTTAHEGKEVKEFPDPPFGGETEYWAEPEPEEPATPGPQEPQQPGQPEPGAGTGEPGTGNPGDGGGTGDGGDTGGDGGGTGDGGDTGGDGGGTGDGGDTGGDGGDTGGDGGDTGGGGGTGGGGDTGGGGGTGGDTGGDTGGTGGTGGETVSGASSDF